MEEFEHLMVAQTLSQSPNRLTAATSRLALPSLKVAVALPLAYFLAASGALALSGEADNVAAVWLSASILLVALIRSPRRTWPVLLLLAGVADVAAALPTGRTPATAVALCLANLSEPLLVLAVLTRFRDGRPWFVSPRNITLFGLAATFSAFVAGFVGSLYLALTQGAPFVTNWWHWTVADAFGLLIVTPVLMSWTEKALTPSLTLRGWAERIALVVGMGGVAVLSFGGTLPFLFGAFPYLVLVTFRTGLRGATAAVAVLAIIAFGFTFGGIGPVGQLQHLEQFELIQILQVYLLSAMLLAVPIAVVLAQRAGLSAELAQQAELRVVALDAMAQGLSMFDSRGRLVTCNSRFLELYGIPASLSAPGTPLRTIVEERIAAGGYDGTFEKFCLDTGLSGAASHGPRDVAIGGRILEMNPKPLADGGWVTLHEDVTERRQSVGQIAFLASHDALTGLSNRAFFDEHLQIAWARAERGQGFALHTIDLDRFKEVNDTLGHGPGDELLRQVAARLREAVRDGDLVTRLGGDEFAVIQYDVDGPEAAACLANRIVAALAAPYVCEGNQVAIGATIGIALAPQDASDAKALLKRSDLALYRGKADGRATFRFFEPAMDADRRDRRRLESQLRSALGKGEFELNYQPILDLASNAISGFEALIRWRHPTRGLLQPAAFIPMAEESGLIMPIGEWVLEEACREAVGWPADVRLAVNLPPVQFKRGDLLTVVAGALERAGLPPERLELEVTESVLLQDEEWVRATLYQLRKLGVGIAMDDFGTGYSSLAYLRSFLFSKIKIDRLFVSDLAARADSLAIVHATIDLSRKLGMTTTAEGVETAEQLAILKAEGCSEVQGFFIGRPVSARDAARLLIERRPPRLVA
jgi:diguanylate cyclase (GGDEF)-like protein